MPSLAYRRANFRRACDDCGHMWPFSQLRYVGLNRWVCPDDKKMLTREQIARHLAKPIPSIFGPRRQAKTSQSIGIYQGQEAEHLNICAAHAATASRVGQKGERITGLAATRWPGVCESLRYLGTLAVEANRPAAWVSLARAAAISLADRLLTVQVGSPTELFPDGSTTNHFHWGSISPGGFDIGTRDTAIAGIGFLRAYTLTGAQKYLDGALRVATFVRNNQRADLGVTFFTTSSSGGTGRLYLGGWADGPNGITQFSMSGAACLWFLAELRTVVGGSTLIGATVAGNDLTAATSATIDTAISDGLRFYTTAHYGGVAPISAATPKAYLSAFQNAFSGDGAWHLEGTPERFITARDFAYGLRGVYEAGGTVTALAVYSWLLGFTSNAAFHATGNETRAALENTLLGTYEPAFAVTTTLQVMNDAGTAVAATNGASTYDIAATALLAPLTIASGRTLRAVKDELGREKELVSGPQGRHEAVALGPIGSMGLSFQEPGFNYIDIDGCAVAAELYRYAPQAWSGLT